MPFLFVGKNARRASERALNLRKQTCARLSKRIARTSFNQCFQWFFCQRATVNAFTKFGQCFEFSAFVARFQNRLDRCFADALDCGHAKTNRFAVARGREENAALIHIRLQNFDAKFSRLGNVFGKFFRVRHVVCHHGAEKFDGIIRLQICGLIRDDGIRGGVRFVETVAGKFFQHVENLVRFCRRNFIGRRTAFDKRLALLLHFLDLLFAHRAAQQIRRAERKASEQLRRLHDLLLINQDAVSFFGNFFEQRMLVFDFNFAVPALDEIRNQIHRSRAIQRNERGDMFDGTDLKLFAQVAHPARFQLKYAERFRTVQEVVSFFIVERQRVNRHVNALRALDHFAGVADDGQSFQAEKIHFQQTQITDRPHRVLRDNCAVFVRFQRQQIDERLVADDNASRMNTGISREVFEDERGVNQLARYFFVLVSFFQLRHLLQRLRQSHFQFGGN